MKITIKLIGPGGELDSRSVLCDDEDDLAEVSEAIHSQIEDWVLSPGDTIEIKEEVS